MDQQIRVGQPGERQVDLGSRAAVTQVVDLPAQLGTERLRIDQTPERGTRIQATDHRVGADLYMMIWKALRANINFRVERFL